MGDVLLAKVETIPGTEPDVATDLNITESVLILEVLPASEVVSSGSLSVGFDGNDDRCVTGVSRVWHDRSCSVFKVLE